MATIPSNSLQDKIKRIQIMQKQAGQKVGYTECVIKDIFDYMTTNPNYKKYATEEHTLYAMVDVNGRTLYLPFKQSVEEIFSIYGNVTMLRNRVAQVESYDKRIHQGKIVIRNLKGGSLLDVENSVNVFDIGHIF